MTAKMPKVPPANRSPKGPGADPSVRRDDTPHGAVPDNTAEQGDSGNIRQNTRNQGYQQDR